MRLTQFLRERANLIRLPEARRATERENSTGGLQKLVDGMSHTVTPQIQVNLILARVLAAAAAQRCHTGATLRSGEGSHVRRRVADEVLERLRTCPE
jgi:hypothetical protein